VNAVPEAGRGVVAELYRERLLEAVRYFFPDGRVERWDHDSALDRSETQESDFVFSWGTTWYRFTKASKGLTPSERILLASIRAVLGVRFAILDGEIPIPTSFRLFRGLPEDRFVSEFLETLSLPDGPPAEHRSDRIREAVEVLRASALGTYENRRIAMGVLLFGPRPDPCHEMPPRPAGAVRYSTALTGIRSFRRLSDGLQTVALVNMDGLLVEIVDVRDWARPFAEAALPIPCATPFQAHARATLCGGHLCLVLTPHGEIKVFAEGVQVFSFLDGRWRLTDPAEKYQVWANAIGNPALAERLFAVALNLAEERRGGLFLVVDDPHLVDQLVPPEDLLGASPVEPDATVLGFKNQLHYLFQDEPVLDLAPTVVETLARIDGAIVLDRQANLLSFGAILQDPLAHERNGSPVEGGRSTRPSPPPIMGMCSRSAKTAWCPSTRQDVVSGSYERRSLELSGRSYTPPETLRARLGVSRLILHDLSTPD
jgi:hypothetical protein